jgi:hypothetical protein
MKGGENAIRIRRVILHIYEPAGEIALGVQVHGEHPTSVPGEKLSEYARNRRLTHTAFVLDNCYHLHEAPHVEAIP